MSKPLGYFGLDYENPLIKDIAETWGDLLTDLDESSAVWLIGRLANLAWLDGDFDAPTTEAEELIERINELDINERLRLIQAIVNK